MEEQKLVRVIIAEDHIILRQGLRMLLEEDSEIEVVGEAGNGQELLDLLADNQVDVVLMDINMPVMSGVEATEQVVKNYPETKVIALSMLNNLPYVQKMLQQGASGYLLKTTGKDELKSAIKLVAGGTNYICSELSMNILTDKYMTGPAEGEAKNESGLSKREIEVLTLIAEGYTNAEIADKLFTSKRTIETHRQNILEKTGAKNTANLIKYAIGHKLIDLEMPE
ncbi:response regulator transcription factor [Pontibacter cellulosilyticus]|uniref:Response regulator transcription factor n=1 Tax=Pontibacter cellulosilyticus TaxID=1720253 RepID=A0A923N873_9BACT|nr:response regulator transcription factor [Pontibacter cellulosilyticus]MBC5992255.1 response regulator transcription factor [Pontibacter cellulosilyticus]